MSTNLDKTALVIGASSESRYAIETAKKRGYKVVAFDGNPDAPGLSWADKGIVTDIRDANNILEHFNSWDMPAPSFVLPVPIGRYLTSTGSVNDALGLKGISHKAANLCTDKYEFHCTLADAGLRNGYCMLIPAGDSADILSTDNIPLPFILKPRFGSGSRGVYLVENVE
ncbi:MAG: hypothetical protein IJB96_10970, partial [Lachnospira sp.]|nr:hypothetical protein [Lachnospira sp.]